MENSEVINEQLRPMLIMMVPKKALLTIAVSLLTSGACAQTEQRLTIPQREWAAIRAAEAEAQRFDPQLIKDMKYYEVWVTERDAQITVVFVDSKGYVAKIGGPGDKRATHFGFRVVLDKANFGVIKSALER